MRNPYNEIFKAPGAKAFSATGFIARLPLAMITLGIVTMLSETHGEYWLAGAVAATFAFSNALIAPQVSRLVDRYGQRRILIPGTIVAVAALSSLMLATRYGAPNWALFMFAVLGGTMPSMSAFVRARWTEIYRGSPKLHTAFAFESVVDEVIFMTGPIVAIGLSVGLFPEAGPLVATTLLAVGNFLFAAQKSTEPPVHAQDKSGGKSVIWLGSMQILVLTLIAIGAIFGTAEVTAVAFAEAQGNKASAGFALSAYAAGSLIAGLAFGALKLKLALPRQLLLAIALAALTTFPLMIVGSIPTLAVVLFVAGVAVSPTIIISMALVEKIVPSSKLTEGMTWAITGIGIGMAVGSSASGWFIDNFGPTSGFFVSMLAGFLALLVTLVGQGTFRRSTSSLVPAPAE
ncbi:MFS transporter [Aminobacter anthyllidis]|uniref:MFS transporter n=1 Tax=Aminobacter anthyllidis TaxID=1035067 RepID=A0A9X1A916_9HYPH|nr:MFS transporter [Aminobacter anthyllidis]MBT1155457.1 MFS transporter [Aminobacter anthyllidis]MDH4985918.1 MFS transporter [Aminobacter anthyllidis]